MALGADFVFFAGEQPFLRGGPIVSARRKLNQDATKRLFTRAIILFTRVNVLFIRAEIFFTTTMIIIARAILCNGQVVRCFRELGFSALTRFVYCSTRGLFVDFHENGVKCKSQLVLNVLNIYMTN